MQNHSEIVKSNEKKFMRIINQFKLFAQQKFNFEFRVEEIDLLAVRKIIAYFFFSNDEIAFLNHYDKMELNTRKGVFIVGPVGCGKTSLLSIIRSMNLNTSNLFDIRSQISIINSKELVLEFAKEGNVCLYNYISDLLDNRPHQGIHLNRIGTLVIDDLGHETPYNYYGNRTDVIEDLLVFRYNGFQKNGLKTHATSNLNSDEIKERYDLRSASRMKEMFNIISFDRKSTDKRN